MTTTTAATAATVSTAAAAPPAPRAATAILGRALAEIRELRAALEAAEAAGAAGAGAGEPVAVIGMACRFPGAPDLDAYWDLLRAGRDATGPVPPDRFDAAAFHDPASDANPDSPGLPHAFRGAFLDSVDGFDPGFFGVSPREAAWMDPQQRLFLEVAWEALEHAGRPAGSGTAKAGASARTSTVPVSTGVFLGVTGFDYSHQTLGAPPSDLETYALTGLASTFSAGRLAHWLGVQGPALCVDTACSSSLVSTHLAVRSLQAGDCELALAGGVNVLLSPEWFVVLSKAGMLSPDGRCKTFDASADGYVRGEGCGVVVLKRLADAEADGDRVLAVIRGSAVNQDGRSSGITVPNGAAQRAVLRAALSRAGLRGGEVDYVEAHGTGTALGDPIEVRALADVYGTDRDPARPLTLGSAKTNIGHLESAAGIAGLIKTVLTMRHGEIPPLVHLTRVNPEIPLAELPVVLPTAVTPWPRGRGPRLAGISSFGASGTNAHLVLAEPPAAAPDGTSGTAGTAAGEPQGLERPEHLVALSARTAEALKDLVGRYAERLADPSGPTPRKLAWSDEDLADVAFTANAGRAHFPHRLAVRARSTAELRERLAGWARDASDTAGVHTTSSPTKARPKVAFLFTGQGSQYPDMGRRLFESHPGFRADLEHCDSILRGVLDRPLLDVLFAGTPASINQTGQAQPALFALQYALARLWRGWGVEPAAMLGHSVGEYAAACAAGVFGVEDGLRLIAGRARLMQELPAGGGMLALRTDVDRAVAALQQYPGVLSLAAVNGPESVVVAGAQTALDDLAVRLATDGVKASPLRVSHAFHSPRLDPMLDEFERMAGQVAYSAPRVPLISNLTGDLADRSTFDARYFRDHARQPVRFREGLERLTQRGCRVFVEIGPTPVLGGMAKETVTDEAAVWLPSLRPGQDAWDTMLAALGRLYTLGADVDWTGFDRGYRRRRVDLPTYPFQRTRHWIESEPAVAAARRPVRRTAQDPTRASTQDPVSPGVMGHGVLGRRLPSPLGLLQYEALLTAEAHPGLRENVVAGTPVVNAGFYLEAAVTLGADLLGASRVQVDGLVMPQALVFPEDGGQLTQVVAERLDDDTATFHHFAALDEDRGTWGLFARGTVGRALDRRASLDPDAIETIEARCPDTLSGSRFYSELWERRLYLGRTSRWLEEIRIGSGEVLARLRPADPGEAEPYRLHPGIIDSALQLVLPCLGADRTAPDRVIILAELDRYTFDPAAMGAAPEDARLVCHARLRDDPASLNSDLLTADIAIRTEAGAVVAEFTGARLRLAHRGPLLAVIRSAPRVWTAPSVPSGSGVSTARAAAPTPAVVSPADLRGLLIERAARALGAAPADLTPDEPLRDLGLDSLMAIELRDAMARDLGVDMPAAVFLDGPTIAGLEAALLPLLVGDPAASSATQLTGEPSGQPAGQPTGHAPARPTVTERTGPGGMHVAELGDGPPVLLVHGGVFGGLDAWRTQTPLADRWRLVVPSRLNYGASATADREDFERDGELIGDLISELIDGPAGGSGVHVVAQSYGTLGAMLAAAGRPGAVRSLTLIESPASAVARGVPAVDGYEAGMRRLLDQSTRPSGSDDDLFRAFYALIDPVARFPDPLPPALARFAAGLRATHWPWEAELAFDALRDAPFPTLVITGGERPVFEAIGDALARRLAGGRLVLPGGHGTQNVGAAFNEALEEFLIKAVPTERM
jgi:acyl transferase domain-containing protein/pimeloyl-ACP methyl ester carboxylesterase